MKIYVVSMSTTTGPYGPSVDITYHKTKGDALAAFTDCQNSLGDDPSTILIEELDTDTMTAKVIDSFEGTLEDYDDSYDPEDIDGDYAGHVGVSDVGNTDDDGNTI